MLGYRRDIDGLRAIAVSMVVLFHAFPGYLRGGFIGVDLFFVISGYLITAISAVDLERGAFSFRAFYARRIRRIVPALALVLVTVLLVGTQLLFPGELRSLARHTVAGALSVANLLSWSESGYFDTISEYKPLLHLWSLAVEEQFYLLWPLVLWVVWRLPRARMAIVAALVASSLCCNLSWITPAPSATFYSPLTRAWELGAGALLALHAHSRSLHVAVSAEAAERNTSKAGLLCVASGLGLIGYASLAFDAKQPFPGWRALLPVTATLLLIAGAAHDRGAQRALGNPWLVYLGKVSYPWYLWHWPALSFAEIAAFGAPSRRLRIGAVLLSLLLAIATYELLEKRTRWIWPSRSVTRLSVLALALCGLLAIPLYLRGDPTRASSPLAEPAQQLEWRYATDAECLARYPYAPARAAAWWFCVTSSSNAPTMLLQGDSNANHLFPGLAQSPRLRDQSILSLGTCQPTDGLRGVGNNVTEDPCAAQHWSEQARFIEQVTTREHDARLALLAAHWPRFDGQGRTLNPTSSEAIATTFIGEDAEQGATPRQVYNAALERRINFLESHGIRVVLVLGIPRPTFDVRQCIARPFISPRKDCQLDRARQLELQRSLREDFAGLQLTHPSLEVFDPLPALCSEETCPLLAAGVPLYRDELHLSIAGSERVAEAFVTWAEAHLPRMLADAPRN